MSLSSLLIQAPKDWAKVTNAVIALTRNCAADVRYIGSEEDLSDDMSIVEIVVIRFQGKADFWLQI